MPGRYCLFLALVTLAGCTKYHSRGSAQARMPSPYAPRSEATAQTPRSPLNVPAMTTSAPSRTAMPAEPTEVSLVPPLPREPVPKDYVVKPPTNPAESPREVVPAAGTLPPVSVPPNAVALQPGKLEKDKRPEPMPAELPSPFATKTTVAPTGASSNNFQKVQQVAATAGERWKLIDTYEARMTRRETVNGKQMPQEEMLYRVRRAPFALYMKSIGETGKGREVIYNPTQHGDLMHIIVGEGDVQGAAALFMKPGSRAPSMSPDDKKVMEKSRHSIREAGFGNSIGRFTALVDKVKTGRAKPETLTFVGAEVHKDLPGYTLERVDHNIGIGEDPQMPRGGKRMWYFDAKPESISYGMPALVVTFEGGREVEYYRFDQFRIPAGLTDTDFDPKNMGKKK